MLDLSEGLRATKKRRTFEDILANGVALFREQGFRGTRTEQIAKASSVSAATLFNYFPTKAALAEAWVRGESDRAVERSASEFEARGLRPALRAACRALAGQVADAPALRLEAWRATGRAREQALSASHPLIAGILREQSQERIRQDLPATLLAELILDAIESGVVEGLRLEHSAENLARGLQARVDLILDGARKRNERVGLPGTARGVG